MTATNINICTDGELEARAQSVLASLGLDMTTAINMFLTQVVDREVLPFEMDEAEVPRKKRPRSEIKGSMKIWMADDFDAPLEEMRGITEPVNRTFQIGCMKGEIWMADDFDAPMEEFEEYM